MHRRLRGFTLVELLVVIGIIGLLISILLPALSGAQKAAKSVACQSNLKQNYTYMLMYANDNKGVLFPMGLGAHLPREQRWPNKVFKPARYDPPTMFCPVDENPAYEHSYLVNAHIAYRDIKYGKTWGVSSSLIILMGEKRNSEDDYYMEKGDFEAGVVEQYMHGPTKGSNYLYLDGHCATDVPLWAVKALDPWEMLTESKPPENPANPNPHG